MPRHSTTFLLFGFAILVTVHAQVSSPPLPPSWGLPKDINAALDSQSWCPDCVLPPTFPEFTAQLRQALVSTNSAVNAACGDGVCNNLSGETCYTCPKDCGSCRFRGPITSCRNSSHVALTFDDGPSVHTSKLLDTLKAFKAKATFFVLGKNLLGGYFPDVLGDVNGRKSDSKWATRSQMAQVIKRAYDEGHDIGSHTYSHLSLTTGQQEAAAKPNGVSSELPIAIIQLLATDRVIEDVIEGKSPRLMRPPFLEADNRTLGVLESFKYIPLSANADSRDWQLSWKAIQYPSRIPIYTRETAQKLMEDVSKQIAMGSGIITLQHDTYAFSVDAVPRIINQLRRQNMEIVPMDTCLGVSRDALYTRSRLLASEASAKPNSPPIANAPASGTPPIEQGRERARKAAKTQAEESSANRDMAGLAIFCAAVAVATLI